MKAETFNFIKNIIKKTLEDLLIYETLNSFKIKVQFEKELCSFIIIIKTKEEVTFSLQQGIQKKFKNIISNKGISFNYIFIWRN